MIQVHHLNNSRSQRILWALEELGLEYELVPHQRDAQTQLAPPSLEAIHPLGKAPILADGDVTVIESGAILEYLARRHGGGRLAPAEGSPEWVPYIQLMHYAEGSAMLPVMMTLYLSRIGDAGAPLRPRVSSELARHVGYLDRLLDGREYFVGDDLTMADIQLSFVFQATRLLAGLDKYPHAARFLDRVTERPAYQRALERGGASIFR
jgi:glutathione S-transferase